MLIIDEYPALAASLMHRLQQECYYMETQYDFRQRKDTMIFDELVEKPKNIPYGPQKVRKGKVKRY